MLSLSPRMDLFRFVLPKDFLPKEVEEKYFKLFQKDSGVITSPIDYLNESIIGVSFPGITDINIVQEQHSHNKITPSNNGPKSQLGRLNIEPKKDMIYTSTENPLEKIDRDFKVTFRLNQGLYNYFMLYETIFHKICKPYLYPPIDVLYIDILNEDGLAVSRVLLKEVHIDGIDGLDFDYTKIERDSGTFQVSFKFNNIDFKFMNDVEL